MRDGEFEFYALQHRRTHTSPWLKPEGKLKSVKDDNKEWDFSSWDVFGGTAEPWCGSGNDHKPKFKKAHDETMKCGRTPVIMAGGASSTP